jgi:glycosyltransferase involved in cell wall biosynthesis
MTARPTIALFLPSLGGGGAEKVFLHLGQGFAERGAEVHLVLARAEGPYLPLVPDSLQVVDLGASRVLRSLPALVCYLRRARPVALLSALDHANVVALWAQKLARVPTRVVVTVHNTPSQATAQARTLSARLMRYWVKPFYPWAHAVVAVSKGVANDLVQWVGVPADKVRVIYNPIITPELFHKAEEPLDHPWFQPGQPPVILGAGRLTTQKDFPTLLRAFALVRAQRPARLMILGEGELRADLERLAEQLGIAEDFALPGFVQNPYPYLKRAAVFVLSSRWEGLPTVLVEALALGTPVVSTDCPSGPREIHADGKWGRLVPVGDAGKLAEAILETLRQPKTTVDKQSLLRFTVDYAVEEYAKVLGLHFDARQGDDSSAE